MKDLKEKAEYVLGVVNAQTGLIKSLVILHDAVSSAMALQKNGHSNGWGYVQSIVDVIGDNYDLSTYRDEDAEEKKYIIEVKAIVPYNELCHDDQCENPEGRHKHSGTSEEKALDKFHLKVPIGCLEDFSITIKEDK